MNPGRGNAPGQTVAWRSPLANPLRSKYRNCSEGNRPVMHCARPQLRLGELTIAVPCTPEGGASR